MKAAILKKISNIKDNKQPLQIGELPVPEVRTGEILGKISACGVCHTELDEIEGRTPPAKLPSIQGHQIIGTVVGYGNETNSIMFSK